MDVRQRLAVNMKRLRKERGWSQEAFADEAGWIGPTSVALSAL
jgi:transcriptional regulator with XRE-family HTH domain